MGAAAPHINQQSSASSPFASQDLCEMIGKLVVQNNLLVKQLQEEREDRKEQNRLMRQVLVHVKTTVKPWLTVDEACQLLGIEKNPSGKYRRRMAESARLHRIKTQGQKPPVYCREDVEALARKVATGVAVRP